MRPTLFFYILREIFSAFVFGLAVFTLLLFLGRLIKLTEMVISYGVPLEDVGRMILSVLPSFLVFTIPMAFFLSVLLTFGRLSADNEITVMKGAGISLFQLLPPVLFSALVALLLAIPVANILAPAGNSAFKEITLEVMKKNVFATIREKIFWDDIPGVVLYMDHYDEKDRRMNGVVINDSRNRDNQLTIFASEGVMGYGEARGQLRFILSNGSIHTAGREKRYSMVNFEQYVMQLDSRSKEAAIWKKEPDMSNAELKREIAAKGISSQSKYRMMAELYSRYSIPVSILVFALLAPPLGIQNRRSGRSSGFSISMALFIAYYILLSLFRYIAERGTFPAAAALWIPDLIFLAVGLLLLHEVSEERFMKLPFADIFRRFRQ